MPTEARPNHGKKGEKKTSSILSGLKACVTKSLTEVKSDGVTTSAWNQVCYNI